MARDAGTGWLLIGGTFVVVAGVAAFSRKASASTKTPAYEGRRVNLENARKFLPSVVKWSKTFNAPPSLVMAIIANESGYNPNATNLTGGDLARGGAWGLAQLTLKTALGYTDANPKTAKQYWPQWNRTGEGLLNPETNIAIACFGIGRNWARYGKYPNNWLTAGLAWNIGAGGLDKLLARGGGSLVTQHPYAQHIGAQRSTNAVVSELYAAEKSRNQFTYA